MLERGEVANSWRRERWDSLRLLTPNWLSRLPGLRYEGPDPDGYMTMEEVTEFIERFAAASRAPVRTGDERHVGAAHRRRVPRDDEPRRDPLPGRGHRERRLQSADRCQSSRDAVPASVEQLTPFDYRDPAKLPDGGVLVVGASATGVQLAAELQRSGRPVTLSVGEHVRLPRTYRGRDVLWWMDASGVWDQRYDEVEDLTRARRLPSPQLVGTPERTTLDLNALASVGVELVGRWAAVRDGRALFSGGLRNVFSLADLKMGRLLDTFDEWARTHGRDAEVGPPERFPPTRVPASTRLQLDLRSGEIRAIVWATGFRPDYGWLDVPALDAKGQLRHEGGVVDSPGPDQAAFLQIVTKDGKVSNQWPIQFTATRAIIRIPGTALTPVACGSGGDDFCYIGSDSDPFTVAGGHAMSLGFYSASGTDVYNCSLKNGWVFDHYQWGTQDGIQGGPFGLAPDPVGQSEFTLAISWFFDVFGSSSYDISVFIIGPVGVPYS